MYIILRIHITLPNSIPRSMHISMASSLLLSACIMVRVTAEYNYLVHSVRFIIFFFNSINSIFNLLVRSFVWFMNQ